MHSPFVYDLLTKCCYLKISAQKKQQLYGYKKQLLGSNEQLSVTDFGAGSRVFKSNKRAVNKIARHAGMTNKRQVLLYKMVHYFKPASIVELGTSLGIATSTMAMANPDAQIITVEGCENTAAFSAQKLVAAGFKNIVSINKSFDAFYISGKIPEKIDLAFIDGNHTYQGTIAAFNALLPATHNDSVLLFDDIYWSKQMTDAWKQICNHPAVTVSIDSFTWGIVFFRKEQKKQHFTIRL